MGASNNESGGTGTSTGLFLFCSAGPLVAAGLVLSLAHHDYGRAPAELDARSARRASEQCRRFPDQELSQPVHRRKHRSHAKARR